MLPSDHCCHLGTPHEIEYNEDVKNDEHVLRKIECIEHVKMDERVLYKIEYIEHVEKNVLVL